MIKKIRHDNYERHRPGVPVMVCSARGDILFQRDGIRDKPVGKIRSRNQKGDTTRWKKSDLFRKLS